MVNNTSALGCNGTYEWLLIRASAIIIFLYAMYLLGFILFIDNLVYDVWRGFFATPITKSFTILSLFSILIHSWIGMWQVLTDYIKHIALRLLLQLTIFIILTMYLLYGSIMVWGV